MRFSLHLLAIGWAAQAAAQTTLSGKQLKIMPLGDSITAGACDANGNGYRLALTNKLDGNQVNMIGSTTDGSARDNQYEAHGGFYIDQIQRLAQNSLNSVPNVYLVHAGTNNLARLDNALCAPAGSGNSTDICVQAVNALDSLLNVIFFSGALLVVAQITPSTNTSYNQRIGVYNQLVANLVNQKTASGGWNLQLANMQGGSAPVTTADIDASCGGTDPNNTNTVHPTPNGYSKMADIWYNALVTANNANKIPALRTPLGVPWRSCQDPTQNYLVRENAYKGRDVANRFAGVTCSDSGTQCSCQDSGSSTTYLDTKTGSCAEMSLGYIAATQWADINGDGRQENVFITPTGGLNISINLGIASWPVQRYGSSTIESSFHDLPSIKVVAPTTTKQYQVRLADLDGDNRAEYIVVKSDGSATGYYNTGNPSTNGNNIVANWASTAVTVNPSFGVSGVGVRYVDFDGDGRADYVWVGANGNVQVWLNQGTQGASAAVNTWTSIGSVGPSVPSGTSRNNVFFADVDADGRADYLIINRQDGSVTAYLNKKPSSGNTPAWSAAVSLASANNGATAVGSGNAFLSDVQFADVDGDGNYDYVVTNYVDSSVGGLKNRCGNTYIS